MENFFLLRWAAEKEIQQVLPTGARSWPAMKRPLVDHNRRRRRPANQFLRPQLGHYFCAILALPGPGGHKKAINYDSRPPPTCRISRRGNRRAQIGAAFCRAAYRLLHNKLASREWLNALGRPEKTHTHANCLAGQRFSQQQWANKSERCDEKFSSSPAKPARGGRKGGR